MQAKSEEKHVDKKVKLPFTYESQFWIKLTFLAEILS